MRNSVARELAKCWEDVKHEHTLTQGSLLVRDMDRAVKQACEDLEYGSQENIQTGHLLGDDD